MNAAPSTKLISDVEGNQTVKAYVKQIKKFKKKYGIKVN